MQAPVIAIILAVTGFAEPGAATSPQAVVQNDESAELDRVVCHQESVIGSRVRKRRVCMTKREWAKLQNGTRQHLDQFIRASTGAAAPINTGQPVCIGLKCY